MPSIDAKEVETRLKALQRAVTGGDSASSITDILKSLLDDVVPTEELLRVRSLLRTFHRSECGIAQGLR
jgi:hypothetical protein